MPRKGVSPALIGGVLAAAAAGMVILGLILTRPDRADAQPVLPRLRVLALGGGLRMITHPKPVYAALYFILTIIASSGLYLLLSAEFMAFALIIIYAGAILITYLFVIMLATQSPDETTGALSDYDASAREPIAADRGGVRAAGPADHDALPRAPRLPSPTRAGLVGRDPREPARQGRGRPAAPTSARRSSSTRPRGSRWTTPASS
jgi:hypothetical protein